MLYARFAKGRLLVIPLIRIDGTFVDVERSGIRDIQPLGEGCVIYMASGPPVGVLQSMPWVMTLWKLDNNRSTTIEDRARRELEGAGSLLPKDQRQTASRRTGGTCLGQIARIDRAQ
jgi:hypothetical protein